MTLSPDVITLAAPDVRAAHAFYTATFSPTSVADYGEFVNLDLHGTGHVALYGPEALTTEATVDPATSGFRGYIMSYIVNQPSEVSALLDAAVQNGATVLEPAKKMMYAGFSATFRAPDGAIWKVAAPSKKDTGPAGEPPVPTESGAILGVAEPKASKAFYETLGMKVDNDYGDKFIDFLPNTGTCRLGLMQRKVLAKDVNVDQDGSGFHGVVLNRDAVSRAEVDTLVAAAAAAGGTVAAEPAETEWGGYSGHFTDLDGYLWKAALVL